MGDNKYIYQIYTKNNILKYNKYLIIYKGYSYEYERNCVYCIDELSYDEYIKNDLGSESVVQIFTRNVCNLAEIKQSYLDLQNDFCFECYCCNTNENELNTELPRWQKIREDTKEQRESDEEEERIKQRKIERKQYLLNQISENKNDIVNLNSKIKTVNDEYIKTMASNLIGRLEKENEGLSSELNELSNI